MEVFGHRDCYAEVQGIGGGSVAVEDEVAGDAALGDADGGAGGAGESDGSEGVADGCVGDETSVWVEMGAVDLNFSAGHGCAGGEVVEMGCVGGRRVEEAHLWI